MERRRIQVIANPISGRGKAARLVPSVVYELHRRGCHIDFFPTQAPGDARRFAERSLRYEAVVAIGGDGTIHEVINGLPGPDAPPLAVIPTGTANVLAKEIGLPWLTQDLADVITHGRVIPWDVGFDHLSGRRFLLFASSGYDAYIVHRHLTRRKGTIQMWQYFAWGFESVLSFVAPRITVHLDGKVVEEEASWVTVTNGAEFGGPLVLVPGAKPGDGLLDVMVQRAPFKRDAARMIFAAVWQYVFRRRWRMPDVRFFRARRIRLHSPEPYYVQMDGDPAGKLPLDIEVIPAALRVLAP